MYQIFWSESWLVLADHVHSSIAQEKTKAWSRNMFRMSYFLSAKGHSGINMIIPCKFLSVLISWRRNDWELKPVEMSPLKAIGPDFSALRKSRCENMKCAWKSVFFIVSLRYTYKIYVLCIEFMFALTEINLDFLKLFFFLFSSSSPFCLIDVFSEMV